MLHVTNLLIIAKKISLLELQEAILAIITISICHGLKPVVDS